MKINRVQKTDFDEILGLIEDDVTKTNTNMCDSVPANIISSNNIVFGYRWQLHKPSISVPSSCKYFVKVYPQGIYIGYRKMHI